MASSTDGNNLEVTKTTFRAKPNRAAQRIVTIRDPEYGVHITVSVSEKGRNAMLYVDGRLQLEFDPREL